MRRPLLALVAALVLAPALRAQTPLRDERGSRAAERKAVLDANRAALTVFNYGLSGGVGEVRGNWPRGSDDFYLGDLMFVVGTEVTDDNGDLQPVVVAPRGPAYRGIPYNPDDPADAWTWEAVPGYAADGDGRPATSTAPETWPAAWPDRAGDAADPGWPGAWDGLLGKNQFVDGAEVYSHLADDAVRTVDYTPDPADPSRGGVGLVARQRAVALRDAGFEDAVIYVWDLVNTSPRDLDHVAAGVVAGTLVGGDGDSHDDVPGHDAARGLVYSYDFDGVGNAGQSPVGLVGVVWLPTPGVALGGARHFAPSNIFPLSNESTVWEAMETGGLFPQDDCAAGGGCDGDVFVSSTVFGLPAFSTQRVAAAVVFGATLASLQRQADALRALAASDFAFSDGLVTATGTQTPAGAEVSWTSPAPDATVRLDLTADGGQTWTPVADGLGASGTLTAPLPPSATSRVRVTAFTPGGAGRAETGWFYQGDAPPVAVVTAPRGSVQGTQPVGYEVAGSAPPLAVALYTRLPGDGDSYVLLDEATVPSSSGAGAFGWDTRLAPNGPHRLRLVVTDADGRVGVRDSDPVLVANPRAPLAAGGTYTGVGDGAVEVREALPEATTGHTYRVVFAGGPERADTYTVTDETAGAVVLGPTPLPPTPVEGPLFDGLRLVVLSPETAINTAAWTVPDGQFEMAVTVPHVVTWGLSGRALPYDYAVAFSDAETTMSLGGFRVGTTPLAPMAVARLTNVTVTNTTLGRPTPFVFLDRDNSGTGRFTATDGVASSDIVIVYECPRPEDTCGQAERVPAALVRAVGVFDGAGQVSYPGRPPTAGDVLAVGTVKAVQAGDTFRFDAVFVVPGEAGPGAGAVALAPAAPNPARAHTTLRFTLAAPGPVRLRLFDVLGREVAVLADGERGAGAHTVAVETARLAPGVYLARLDAAGAAATRRFVVVR